MGMEKDIELYEMEISEYESLLKEYRSFIIDRFDKQDFFDYNEILFSAHSCGIEGNSFSVDDTRDLKEKDLGKMLYGKTLYEAFEILDHFKACEYLFNMLDEPLSENLLKETHRLLTEHTLRYRIKGSAPGEYTDTDMAAGDTIFGDHRVLVAHVPRLLEVTQKEIEKGAIHPVVLSAKFHCFFEYLHPFRDGNGRMGRLFSNFILLKLNQPMVIITREQKDAYIKALKLYRKERTDEYIISFFFNTAIERMKNEINDKKNMTGNFIRGFEQNNESVG
jgi:Fic family protein